MATRRTRSVKDAAETQTWIVDTDTDILDCGYRAAGPNHFQKKTEKKKSGLVNKTSPFSYGCQPDVEIPHRANYTSLRVELGLKATKVCTGFLH